MTSPRTLLAGHDIRAKKQLGQNFLSDPSTAEMIVRRGNFDARDVILEIGAGLGALTVPAARAVRTVYAVETDRRLIGLLKTELRLQHLSNVTVLQENILKLDMAPIADREQRRLQVLGNLPYNISSQILVWLINARKHVDRSVLMFQSELARRIGAAPGGKDYGRISVMIQYCADVKTIAGVQSPLFFPRPQVDSEILEFRFHPKPRTAASDETFFFRLVKAAFSKRRKTLKNALAASELHLAADDARGSLQAVGIDPVRRAETLTVTEFVRLSNHLAARNTNLEIRNKS